MAEPAGLVKQEHRRIVLPWSRFNDTWWQQHLSTALTPAAHAVPDEQPNNPALTAKAKCAVRTNAEQSLDTATRIAALEAACVRVQEEFQNLFAGVRTKTDRIHVYYTQRLAIARENASMAQGEVRAVSIAARVAHVQSLNNSTTRNWISSRQGARLSFSITCVYRHEIR